MSLALVWSRELEEGTRLGSFQDSPELCSPCSWTLLPCPEEANMDTIPLPCRPGLLGLTAETLGSFQL